MNDRPTPEQIADCSPTIVSYLAEIEHLGYRIVHPDDVPLDRRPSSNSEDAAFARGWNNCRILYFGGDDE